MTRRAAFTLVEAAVAFAVAAVVMAAAWNAIQMMTAGEKSVDRASVRAIREAVLLEVLLRDLRSARKVELQGPQTARLEISVLDGDRLEAATVTWRPDGAGRVVREQQGGPSHTFDFSDVLEPGSPPFTLRIEPVEDVLFIP